MYQGSYQPLVGVPMSDAYSSVVDLSMNVRAGLLIRQVHHWAALVFVAALIIHLLRMFFTGAYRRPRRINWIIGLSLLLLVGFNGLMGYSLPDDLLSGTGLRIAYSITESIPFVGPPLASLLFGGDFPTTGIIARIYPVHIFLLPAAIAGLLGRAPRPALAAAPHASSRASGRDDRTIVGTPMVPAYALRTTGYFMLIAGVLTAFGGLVQINPVWLYGPFLATDATTSAQPDWYMGWLEGAVRMMPGWDIHIGGFTAAGDLLAGGDPARASSSRRCSCGPGSTGSRCATTSSTTCCSTPASGPGGMAIGAGFVTFLSRAAGGRRRRRVRQRVRVEPADVCCAPCRCSSSCCRRWWPLVTYAIARRRAERWLVPGR